MSASMSGRGREQPAWTIVCVEVYGIGVRRGALGCGALAGTGAPGYPRAWPWSHQSNRARAPVGPGRIPVRPGGIPVGPGQQVKGASRYARA